MSKKRDKRPPKALQKSSKKTNASLEAEPPEEEIPTGTTELEAVQIIHDEPPEPPPLPSDVLVPNTADAQQIRRSTARALRFLGNSEKIEFTASPPTQPEVTGATARESQQDLVAALLAVGSDVQPADTATDATGAPATSGPAILRLPATALPWHRIDYRGGLLLARVDGQRSRDEVVAASGLPAKEASALLDELIAQGLLLAAPD